MKIALIVNTEKEKAINCSKKISELFDLWKVQCLMHSAEKELAGISQAKAFDTYEELISACDVVVTVGGDGTFIRSARFAVTKSKPIIGINLGRLGYVAELEESEISMLSKLISGDFSVLERTVLSVEVRDEKDDVRSFLVVNDANISRSHLSGMAELEVCADGEKIASYRADGLLFSTPTGSTAYALSAGGPVIDPKLNLIELTPLCPHSLTARPVLFSNDTVFTVVSKTKEEVYLAVDGQEFLTLKNTDTVKVRASEYKLSTIVLKDRNFYKLAGEKLREGEFK